MMNNLCNLFFFFFKQKTAYEMLRSLVGSEMCIRDRPGPAPRLVQVRAAAADRLGEVLRQGNPTGASHKRPKAVRVRPKATCAGRGGSQPVSRKGWNRIREGPA